MADYIDRDALIAHMKDVPTWWEDGGGVYGSAMKYPEGTFNCEDVIASIENAPAADVQEVRHGSWIPISDGDGAECSECGEYYDCGTRFELFKQAQRFCPSCGAKMDKGESEK